MHQTTHSKPIHSKPIYLKSAYSKSAHPKQLRSTAAVLLLVILSIVAVWTAGNPTPWSTEVWAVARAHDRLILATTTSTDNSGLLDVLIPPFEREFGVDVQVVAVGTGKALELGKNGDADVVLVHARQAEDAFIEAGYGVNRRDVMYNDFVILGPASDPANIRAAGTAREAFRRIYESRALFVSRGDGSGTHQKEIEIWKGADLCPEDQSWYMSVGQGMGAALNIAGEKNAYVLSDRGTYLAYKDKIDLELLFEGDPLLFNPYGVIAVNPARHPDVNYVMAMAFIGYITSVEGQALIDNFRINGQQLFRASALQR